MNITDAELEQYILANYPQKSLTRMAEACSTSRSRIRRCIQALGIEDKAAERKFRRQELRDAWRQKHLEYVETIERMAPSHSWKEIAQVLGVKRSRISGYVNKKGLTHTPETYEALQRRATKAILSAPWTEERKPKISRSLKEILAKEQLRVRWGLPQRTGMLVGRTSARIKQARVLLFAYGYFGFRDDTHTQSTTTSRLTDALRSMWGRAPDGRVLRQDLRFNIQGSRRIRR